MSDGLVHRVREAAGEPQGALILLHGDGADEHDLVPVLDVLDPERLLVALTPRGFPDPATLHATHLRLTGFFDDWLTGGRSAGTAAVRLATPGD